MAKQCTTFAIHASESSWVVKIDDRVFSFATREDAVEAGVDVARDLATPVDIIVDTDGAGGELVWTSDPTKLLQDMYQVWLAAARRPG